MATQERQQLKEGSDEYKYEQVDIDDVGKGAPILTSGLHRGVTDILPPGLPDKPPPRMPDDPLPRLPAPSDEPPAGLQSQDEVDETYEEMDEEDDGRGATISTSEQTSEVPSDSPPPLPIKQSRCLDTLRHVVTCGEQDGETSYTSEETTADDERETSGFWLKFCCRARGRAMGIWSKVTSRARWLALGCVLLVIASIVTAAVLAHHLGPGGKKAHDSEQQNFRATGMHPATFYKENSSGLVYLTTPFPSSGLEWANAGSVAFQTVLTTAPIMSTTAKNACMQTTCHHGTCENGDTGYNCFCSPGWTGNNCQQDLNECARNPCQHGRCENKDGGYTCTCSPGWTGQNCQQALSCRGWTEYNNHCYKVVEERASWATANSVCKEQHGANLASIKDSAENNFIAGLITDVHGLLPSSYSYVWVGLHCHKDGRLKWTDGSRVSYTNWAPGQPNNYLGIPQECVGLYTQKYRQFAWDPWAERGQWDDEKCWHLYFYVCRRPK